MEKIRFVPGEEIICKTEVSKENILELAKQGFKLDTELFKKIVNLLTDKMILQGDCKRISQKLIGKPIEILCLSGEIVFDRGQVDIDLLVDLINKKKLTLTLLI